MPPGLSSPVGNALCMGKSRRFTIVAGASFGGLPETFQVTRYHSLVVQAETLPAAYAIDAVSDDGAVMALSHRSLPLYGLQFHPEAVLSEYGRELITTFCRLAASSLEKAGDCHD